MFGLQKLHKQPLPPPTRPKGVVLEQRIGIQVPAHDVWDILKDPETWPNWSPRYTNAAGVIAFDEVLEITTPTRQTTVRIVEWEPDAQIVWRDHIGFAVKSLRYLELDILGEASTVFTTGEIFQGFAAKHWLKCNGKQIYADLGQECQQMKQLAEGK